MSAEEMDFGIKYKVVKLKDGLFFMIPLELVEGYAARGIFYNENELKILGAPCDLAGDTVIDTIFSGAALRKLYEFDDISFLKEYFLADEKEKIQIVTISKGQMQKFKVDARVFENSDVMESFFVEQGRPAVTLNEQALDDLINSSSEEDIRTKLLRYKNLAGSLKKREKSEGLTSITVKNGTVTEIVSKNKVVNLGNKNSLIAVSHLATGSDVAEEASVLGSDISLLGLETYIRERIFGHDKEIKVLAKSILMNYTAKDGEKVEPILLIGPTGTGKTETMHAVSSYLNIPLIEVNTVNLVPQGLKGMSLEDCLYSLIVSCNYDVAKAQRGMVFFDEFDKLGMVSTDYKSSVIQILLKFIEGGTFMIDKPTDDYSFDTTHLNKIFAGAFTDLFEQDKRIGFLTSEEKGKMVFKPSNITDKNYYGRELVTRIPHILVYSELSREEKKKAILYSKVSEYLIKKQRYARQFGVTLDAEDSYFNALLDKLDAEQRSMRDLNNVIIESLDDAEYQMLASPDKYRRLVLTAETVGNNQKYDLS